MTRSACTVINWPPIAGIKPGSAAASGYMFCWLWCPSGWPWRHCLDTPFLRPVLAPDVPFSYYSGPLSALWPLAFLLLLTSYVSDCLLWRDEWAE